MSFVKETEEGDEGKMGESKFVSYTDKLESYLDEFEKKHGNQHGNQHQHLHLEEEAEADNCCGQSEIHDKKRGTSSCQTSLLKIIADLKTSTESQKKQLKGALIRSTNLMQNFIRSISNLNHHQSGPSKIPSYPDLKSSFLHSNNNEESSYCLMKDDEQADLDPDPISDSKVQDTLDKFRGKDLIESMPNLNELIMSHKKK